VTPIKCPPLSRCPAGTVKALKTPAWILIGFIIAILAIFFAILYVAVCMCTCVCVYDLFVTAFTYSEYARNKKRKLQDLALSKEEVDDSAAIHGSAENPMDMLNDNVSMYPFISCVIMLTVVAWVCIHM
jgi:hypothetical protein